MFVSFCNCLAMPALLRQLWPRVVSEAKAALACNELINDAKKRAEALLQLLGAMSGRDLVLRVKELAALHEEDVSGEAGSIKNELEGNLKLLREYVQGVGNCAKELDHAVTFLGMCWPDSGVMPSFLSSPVPSYPRIVARAGPCVWTCCAAGLHQAAEATSFCTIPDNPPNHVLRLYDMWVCSFG